MNQPKELLIITYSLRTGGAENMIFELIKKIDTKRYKPHLICCSKEYKTVLEEKVREFCDTTFLNMSGTITPKNIITAHKAISKISPDIIHAHLGSIAFALPWAFLKRKPCVVTVHTIPQNAFSKKNALLLKLSLKFAKTSLVAVSMANKKACEEYYNTKPDQCFCVNNGVDEERFFKTEHKDFTFINVASHNVNKNQKLLLNCFERFSKKHENSKLLLLGDGATHNQLIEQAKKLDIEENVVFTGNVADTENYYSISDVYVHSSHVEAMPMSILEAITSGLPVISTDVGGIKDVVKTNGFLVADDDEAAFLECMEKIYSLSNEEREEMEKASKEIAKAYSSKKMAEEYMQIYDKML